MTTTNGEVLHVGEYRGIKLYVRKLGRELFEVLLPINGEIHAHQLEIQKKMGDRLRNYTDEELKGCVAMMIGVGEQVVDDRLFEIEVSKQFKNRLKRLKGRIKAFAFHIKYKISLKIDEQQTKRKGS